jgi:hypothetical protein
MTCRAVVATMAPCGPTCPSGTTTTPGWRSCAIRAKVSSAAWIAAGGIGGVFDVLAERAILLYSDAGRGCGTRIGWNADHAAGLSAGGLAASGAGPGVACSRPSAGRAAGRAAPGGRRGASGLSGCRARARFRVALPVAGCVVAGVVPGSRSPGGLWLGQGVCGVRGPSPSLRLASLTTRPLLRVWVVKDRDPVGGGDGGVVGGPGPGWWWTRGVLIGWLMKEWFQEEEERKERRKKRGVC